MDVLCLGILVADVFASPVDSLPNAGELTITDRFLSTVGGCAANTAVDLRRLNRSVAVAGKIGCDMFGDFVVGELQRQGIEVSSISRSPTLPTASTVILNVRGEDRRYLHCIGANAEFSLSDFDFRTLENARILYVGGYLAMPGFSPDDLAHLFEAAHRRTLTTVLDVVIPAGASVSLDCVKPVLPFTDYFLPNQDEARRLTGLEAPAAQAKRLGELNPSCTIVITRGREGSLARCGTALIDTAPFQVESIDESGAGDAFAAGFITGLLENWAIDDILCFAGAVGASCTRALGCHAGVFRFDEAVQAMTASASQAGGALDKIFRLR
jgi:sugar/nucleoside kinase (ribokinase family)